jgi:hypothetical protein
MYKYFTIITIFLAIALKPNAQELNCQVSVSGAQAKLTETIQQALQKSIYEFMNQTKWTNYNYKVYERIECSMMLTISDWNLSDKFKGSITVQSRRPVFNTSTNTVLFNFKDNNLEFTYNEGDPLDFQLSVFTNNLTSTMAYYAYIILGLDFASMQQGGGNVYFQNAQTIVNNAQNAPESGWKAFESRQNRYWLTENLMNSAYKQIPQILYKYHRLGMDVMYDDLEKGRASITECLTLMQQLKRNEPNLFFLQTFLDAKRQELIDIYKTASPVDKPKAKNILVELDPTHSSEYQKILQNK